MAYVTSEHRDYQAPLQLGRWEFEAAAGRSAHQSAHLMKSRGVISTALHKTPCNSVFFFKKNKKIKIKKELLEIIR